MAIEHRRPRSSYALRPGRKAARYYHFTSKEQILDELLAAPPVAALARGAPGEGAAVRAQAALTVAKQVTLAVLGDGGPMSAGTRAEILAAALRALDAT